MTEKSRIIGALGESRLLLPSLLNAALAANDQVKYLFTLLQLARQRADQPHAALTNLQGERLACGLDEDELDAVIEGSRATGPDTYAVPQAERIVTLVMRNVKSMLDPLRETLAPAEADAFEQRYQQFLLTGVKAREETITGETISLMTSANRDAGDSLHLLVMDVHKALNRLQGSIAAETIDGAKVYEVKAPERPVIRAFMRGVHQTAGLKFDHPGLGTTATHANDRLVIQNDIGTTDAHVLVVHVSQQAVTITYTDVHLQRLLFFESLFERYHMRWDDTLSRKDNTLEEGVYHLSVGRYEARTRQELEEFVAFLGSRLVFLIDWNRARKRLRNFLRRDRVVQLLKWAADENIGHMAFLKCGGETLVFDALDFVVRGGRRYPQRLDEMLGADEATQYMRFVLRACSEGLAQGRLDGLIRDELKAELLNYFRSAQQSLLDIVADHAVLVVELAGALRDALLKLHLPDARAHLDRAAGRAKEWERQADAMVNDVREAMGSTQSGTFFRDLVQVADDVADDLEETAFNLTLLPAEACSAGVRENVVGLAGLLVQGTQEYLKAIETMRYVHRGALREYEQDFLESIHRVTAIEQRTDEAQREIKRALLRGEASTKALFVYNEAVRTMERSADGLMHASLMLRDYVLGEVMAR